MPRHEGRPRELQSLLKVLAPIVVTVQLFFVAGPRSLAWRKCRSYRTPVLELRGPSFTFSSFLYRESPLKPG